ncbi:MAG: hypothetical protein LBM99_05930 [Bacillales bacterium]|nr:hypothetical protein [Bacillales bacterium]
MKNSCKKGLKLVIFGMLATIFIPTLSSCAVINSKGGDEQSDLFENKTEENVEVIHFSDGFNFDSSSNSKLHPASYIAYEFITINDDYFVRCYVGILSSVIYSYTYDNAKNYDFQLVATLNSNDITETLSTLVIENFISEDYFIEIVENDTICGGAPQIIDFKKSFLIKIDEPNYEIGQIRFSLSNISDGSINGLSEYISTALYFVRKNGQIIFGNSTIYNDYV